MDRYKITPEDLHHKVVKKMIVIDENDELLLIREGCPIVERDFPPCRGPNGNLGGSEVYKLAYKGSTKPFEDEGYKLCSLNSWNPISINPSRSGHYCIFTTGRRFSLAHYDCKTEIWVTHNPETSDYEYCMDSFTHWMLLEPPKENQTIPEYKVPDFPLFTELQELIYLCNNFNHNFITEEDETYSFYYKGILFLYKSTLYSKRISIWVVSDPNLARVDLLLQRNDGLPDICNSEWYPLGSLYEESKRNPNFRLGPWCSVINEAIYHMKCQVKDMEDKKKQEELDHISQLEKTDKQVLENWSSLQNQEEKK